jgi:hypothetical protein
MKVAEARPSSNCESDLQAALTSLTRNPQRFNVHTSHQVLKSRGARLTAVVADDLDRTNPDIESAFDAFFDAFKDNNVSRATVAEMPSIAETARQDLNGWGDRIERNRATVVEPRVLEPPNLGVCQPACDYHHSHQSPDPVILRSMTCVFCRACGVEESLLPPNFKCANEKLFRPHYGQPVGNPIHRRYQPQRIACSNTKNTCLPVSPVSTMWIACSIGSPLRTCLRRSTAKSNSKAGVEARRLL